MIDASRMCAADHLSEMLKSMRCADDARRNLSQAQKELDEVKGLWESGALKCEEVYSSLVRSYERSIETRADIVKTYDDVAASYSRMLIRSVELHRRYVAERRAPALARPCGF